jgi:tetratricopeptide (TPR) repeat protein
MEKNVLAWQETVYLPTYNIGAPEKNPIFLEKRVYQGSSGVVYPYAVVDKIEDEKKDMPYLALFLENAYLKIMILPQLGGRVYRAYDKIRSRDFVYYNQVVKPALVGLTGPWISGGIEFNWPQHHRPSTFLPVDFTIKENTDGSKTVWINEVERMFRTKCQAGFTLYPDKAYLEISGKLFNRSLLPQTFLWWANPAVKVNEHYQSVFPPDVHAVYDHGKRDVSGFPIATGKYYKVNYAPGTDISFYKNIPVPTSYMAIQSGYDFVGGYEHDTQSGILHVANHHISPGKKQWTWGNTDFGKAWLNNLTDEDGPYIELMTGVFTDNQPDFSWLQPNEEKTFEQYFMPYARVGMVKNATKDAILNIEVTDHRVLIIVYATGTYVNSTITIHDYNGNLLKSFRANLSPLEVFETSFENANIFNSYELRVTVISEEGQLLVDYNVFETEAKQLPLAATPARPPAEISSIEELYLNGLHIEQYRHASYQATDYYAEALLREPNDSRCNNAMGLWLLRYGQFITAESYFRRAIKTITLRNPNPYDGEAFYNLGISLRFQGKLTEAYDAFYKASWNDAWQHASFLQLAKIDTYKKNFIGALQLIEKSLVKNYHSHSARHLKSIICRKLKNYHAAIDCTDASMVIDPFNFGCSFEKYLILNETGYPLKAAENLEELQLLMRDAANSYLEYAFDYGSAGCFNEAITLLQLCVDNCSEPYPIACYAMSYFAAQAGDEAAAKKFAQKAISCSPDYCFPNKLEEINVLQYAVAANPSDDKAFYYLGNLWFGMRRYDDAIHAFENSIIINPDFPTAHRNLALLYYNKKQQPAKALQFMERAFKLDQHDARVLMELDQLYKRLNYYPEQRLGILYQHISLVNRRDDLYLERITLENNLGNFREAQEMLEARIFHPWEGGEGKVVAQYLVCHLELAKKAILENEPGPALVLLEAAKKYPPNLGEGKLPGTQENDIHYLEGCAYTAMGLNSQAAEKFKLATEGISEPVQAIFYNDPQADKIVYQGLAWLKLGQPHKAGKIFNRLLEFAGEHFDDKIKIDYFAVSLPDLMVFDKDLDENNKNYCRYLKGLGELGLKKYAVSAIYLREVLQQDKSHSGAIIHLNMIDFLIQQEKAV